MQESSASANRIASLVEEGLAHHRAGRLAQAAQAYRQVLAAQPEHALVLSLLGNVHYQQGENDAAVQLISKAIALEPSSPAHRISLGHVHRRLAQWSQAARCYREAFGLAPDSLLAASSLAHALKEQGELGAALAVLRQLLSIHAEHAESQRLLADLLVALGQPAQARQAYRRLLELEPETADVLFRSAVASSQSGDAAGAIEGFQRVLAIEPDHARALYNLGVIDAQRQRLDSARAWFRRALEVDPDCVDARINLAAVLFKSGQRELAQTHRELAYRSQCLFVRPAPNAKRSVLVLFDAGNGNINLTHLFARESNQVIDWMIEYAPPGQVQSLPAYDLVFNAMGDPDMVGAAVAPAAQFIAACERPVLNRPERVALTSREKIPALLSDIHGLALPQVWRVAPHTPWPQDIASRLPLLVRPVDTHGGMGLQRVTRRDELDRVMGEQSEPLYVAAYCDFASADGFYRKYRVIFIDREPYAYHLAISPNWLVHYATAEMTAHPWKLEEERRFLDDPKQVLGPAGYAAIAAIGARLDLDYAGVDFSMLPDGRVLVFEANPVMLVHPEEPDSVTAFKNPSVQRILDAFEALLARATARRPSAS